MNLKVGDNYYVRTATDHWVGRLVKIDGPYTVTLEDFAWIANSGRLHAFLKDGGAQGMEIEPAPEGRQNMVQWMSIIDWPFKLLRDVV